MTEQIVEFKDDINFAVKLDELDYEKALVSPKQNIGHLLWFNLHFNGIEFYILGQ